MRTICLYILSLAVVGGFSFFGGRLLERSQQAPVEPVIVVSDPVVIEAKVEVKEVESPPLSQVTDTAALIASAADQLAVASVSQMGLLEVYRLLGKLQPEDIAEALTEIEKLPHGEARQSVTAAVVARWAQTDGVAAIDYALTRLTHANRPAALAGALSAWSDVDPEGALSWYQSETQSDPDFELVIGAKPAYLLPTIFEGLAGKDISSAYAAFSKLGTIEEKDQALDGIAAAGLSTKDVQRALDLAQDTLGDAAGSARLRMIANWGKREPAAAAAWVSAVRDPTEKGQFARSVAQTWIAYEPATAVPWLLENTPVAERATVVELATSIWVHSDPNATAVWLLELPKGPDSDLGVSTLARNIVAIDPEAALKWAKTIESDLTRRQTMLAVIGQWRFREPERAVESLNASGLPAEEIEDYLLRTVPAN